ncbi:MAG: hypothetical protein HRT36_06605 [Alphaproteobacteria bacterium]|nr:hypothetical protein [Alphaproteobacteria bacterium]
MKIRQEQNAREIWPEASKKAVQKDVDARWTVEKFRQGKGAVARIPDLWLQEP